MAGRFNQLGFEVIPTFSGKEGFKVATSRSNVMLVAVHVNVARFPLSQTIANLRADARSAAIPIIVYGPESVRAEVQGALTRYPVMEYLDDSVTTVPRVQAEVGPFLNRALALAPTPEQHSQRVADAVGWLAYIASGNRTDVFDLQNAQSALIRLSTDRALYADAMTALQALPTPAVQRNFEQIAVSELLDPAVRLAAVHHLAAHIQRRGLLLSSAEVAEVESAWKTAKSPEMTTALAAVIGSLQPNARRVGMRLQSVPFPSRPTP